MSLSRAHGLARNDMSGKLFLHQLQYLGDHFPGQAKVLLKLFWMKFQFHYQVMVRFLFVPSFLKLMNLPAVSSLCFFFSFFFFFFPLFCKIRYVPNIINNSSFCIWRCLACRVLSSIFCMFITGVCLNALAYIDTQTYKKPDAARRIRVHKYGFPA